MTLRLWQLTPDRAREWCDIRQRALRDSPAAFGADAGAEAELSLSDHAARLAACDIWAAGLEPGQPLAVAGWETGISPAEPDLGWIGSVFVDPQARGQGLADAILARLAQRAARAGMTRLGLHVAHDNHFAHALYFRAGFVATGNPPMLNAAGQWEIEMRRMLRPPLLVRLRALRA